MEGVLVSVSSRQDSCYLLKNAFDAQNSGFVKKISDQLFS